MDNAQKGLEELRREIDDIDDALHDLLVRRADIVAAIGELKKNENGPVFRPGREACLLRRLLARRQGALPEQTVVQVWREIVSGATRIQGGLTVGVAPVGEDALGAARAERLARSHFGANAPVVHYESPVLVLGAVASGSVQLGLLPVPHQDEPRPWWVTMREHADGTRQSGQIIARVPIFTASEAPDGDGFIIAAGEPEPSGDDRTVIVFECDEPVSRGRIHDVLAENGFAPALVVTGDDARRPGTQYHFADIAGDVAAEDPRLLGVGRLLGAAVPQRLGLYATQIQPRT